jgi:hypothetical protein
MKTDKYEHIKYTFPLFTWQTYHSKACAACFIRMCPKETLFIIFKRGAFIEYSVTQNTIFIRETK